MSRKIEQENSDENKHVAEANYLNNKWCQVSFEQSKYNRNEIKRKNV